MSWTDPCGNCGEHRADCDCKHYTSIQKNTCEYCEYGCKKNKNNEEYNFCEKFKLAKK